MKIAGCVVLYNPNNEVKDNINTYLNDVEVLYCIDNSISLNYELVSILKDNAKIKYIPLGENKGLSVALTLACDEAYKDRYDYIITMDQDTIFEEGSLSNMIDFCRENYLEYSIISPNIKSIYYTINGKEKSQQTIYQQVNHEKDWVITSGSLINLEDYKSIGGFDTKLFIGQIDQDFCCNLKDKNKKIILLGKSIIYQEAGNTVIRKFLFRNIKVPQYNAIRYYYIFRNEIYLRRKWGRKYKNFKASLIKYFIIVLFYEKQKTSKFESIIRGLIDGFNMSLTN